MTSPGEQMKEYNLLYHNFTEKYCDIKYVADNFYPQAKSFVRGTEPELEKYLKRLTTAAHTTTPTGYQAVMRYLSHFDDFTIKANSFFRDLKVLLDESENFMGKVIELKQQSEGETDPPNEQEFTMLAPQLTGLIERANTILPRAETVEHQLRKLESDWQKTKQKISS